MPEFKGLILDWGGVLTTDLHSSMSAWADAEGVDLEAYASVMREWFGSSIEATVNPIHALERGEIEVPEFEDRLANALSKRLGRQIKAEDLLKRLFAHFGAAHDMTALVRRAKAAGIHTALLSNSWGNTYPDHLFDGMFDVVVISGEVGMRKPEPEIFHYTLKKMDLPATACVFVDDIRQNIDSAVQLGIVGIHHKSYHETAQELDVLFGMNLS